MVTKVQHVESLSHAQHVKDKATAHAEGIAKARLIVDDTVGAHIVVRLDVHELHA